jgi:antitoxin (DNA-binding transcriptional repressor) of toxin-antitoxin stability system
MDTISPAELRDHIGEILERVGRGDWFAVTDDGHVAAIISPPPTSTLDGVRPAWQPREGRTDHWSTPLPRRPPSQRPQGLVPDVRPDEPQGRHRR